MSRLPVASAAMVLFICGVGCSSPARTLSREGTGSAPAPTADAGVDAGGCIAATRVPAPPQYTPVGRRTVCSMADVNAWFTACFDVGATQASCNTWAQAAANVACAACIGPAALDGGAPPASGALVYDQNGIAYLNLAGCVAVTDGNETCASPLEQLLLCEYDACGSNECLHTATTAQYDACIAAADKGVCASYLSALKPSCSADEADGGALNGACKTYTGMVYAICGNGT